MLLLGINCDSTRQLVQDPAAAGVGRPVVVGFCACCVHPATTGLDAVHVVLGKLLCHACHGFLDINIFTIE
jgi:hypothetical protein